MGFLFIVINPQFTFGKMMQLSFDVLVLMMIWVVIMVKNRVKR
ncbi:hypothetical protein MOOS6835_02510 [Moraxella osloensis]|uniref:Uncharacterized protein n=1 Tax=Faucicola osloensis TaxID=34062 RepID=A0A378QCB3_FAUOS|nr:Uncharacterised protein [Moraxella osloensis]